jgi:hemolysin III
MPAWLPTVFYLGMGWGALFCYFEVVRRLSHQSLIPIVAGGVLYSLGAVFNLLQGPVLWRGVFGAHELFHLFVVAGSMCHFYFMLAVVGPSELGSQFEPPPPASPSSSSTFTAQPLPGKLAAEAVARL